MDLKLSRAEARAAFVRLDTALLRPELTPGAIREQEDLAVAAIITRNRRPACGLPLLGADQGIRQRQGRDADIVDTQRAGLRRDTVHSIRYGFFPTAARRRGTDTVSAATPAG